MSQGQDLPKVGVSWAADTVTEKRVVWAKEGKGEQLRAVERSLSGWSQHSQSSNPRHLMPRTVCFHELGLPQPTVQLPLWGLSHL